MTKLCNHMFHCVVLLLRLFECFCHTGQDTPCSVCPAKLDRVHLFCHTSEEPAQHEPLSHFDSPRDQQLISYI